MPCCLPKVCLTQRIQDAGLSLPEGRAGYSSWTEAGVPGCSVVLHDIADVEGTLVTLVSNVGEELLDAIGGRRPAYLINEEAYRQ